MDEFCPERLRLERVLTEAVRALNVAEDEGLEQAHLVESLIAARALDIHIKEHHCTGIEKKTTASS